MLVARSIGIAQQTIRGVERFFVVLILGKLGTMIVEREMKVKVVYAKGSKAGSRLKGLARTGAFKHLETSG